MRKGIELSINFIVVFIISIVILFFGIKLIHNIICEGEKIELIITQRIDDELGKLAMQEQRISIAFNSETISPGNHHVFGLGVLNIDATRKYFAIGVEPGPAYDMDNNEIVNPELQFLYDKKATIALDELKKIPIGVKVPSGTKPGTYTVNVYVCHDETEINTCTKDLDNYYDEYHPTRNIHIEVSSSGSARNFICAVS